MATGSGWQVTGQLANQVKNTPTGSTVDGTYVFFTTGDGNAGAVFVPDNIYKSKVKVRALIAEQAAALDEVGNMFEAGTGQ